MVRAMSNDVSSLLSRFVIVAGKGGVGKSTLCAALGLAAARMGRRTIVAELNTKEQLPAFFDHPGGGYRVHELAENLYSINIQRDPALREYGIRKLKFAWVYERVFENEAMRRMLRMVPGMTELVLLGKAFDLERERDSGGRPRWDTVIVDAPATGHGVSLLRLPEVILKVSGHGLMAEEARDMRRLLTDPSRTLMHLVTLPEEMPIRETFELHAELTDGLKIPTGHLVVNGVWPEVIDDDGWQLLREIGDHTPDTPWIDGTLRTVTDMRRRHAMQRRYLAELVDMNLPTLLLPYLFTESFGREAIAHLSQVLTDEAKRLQIEPAMTKDAS